MKKIITLLISAMMILALCVPAFAAEAPKEEPKEYYPVVGSWKLDTVFHVIDGQEPAELKKEEAQSLYGSGINIFTFDEDGSAHDILFAGPDTSDTAAKWTSTSPNVYVYTEEGGLEITFYYEAEKDVLHRSFENTDADASYKKLDFVYARAVVGSWKLEQVLEIHEGDAPVEMNKEDHQSLYAEAENILTFCTDGTVKNLVKGGGEETVESGTWKMPEPDKFVYTIETTETEMDYFRVDDTLFRDVKTDADQPYLRFIYARYEESEEEKAPEATAQEATQAAAQADPNGEEPLIADGKIFTGNKLYNMIDVATGEYVVLSELNQGGWANEETGEIFHWGTPQYDSPSKIMFGDRDTVLWVDTTYYEFHSNIEEQDGDGPVIVDYQQDGTPIYSDDPRIIDFREDGTPVYAIPEDSTLYEEGEGPVIVDYQQDGTPIYSDDPRIIDFRQDGTPVYALPEGSEYYDDYDDDESPVIVDYQQDGTPIYSDDPRIVDFNQDGSPVYGFPTDD